MQEYTPGLDSPDMRFLGYAYFSKRATSGIRFLGYACFSRASPPPLVFLVLFAEPQHGLCTVGILSVHRGRLKSYERQGLKSALGRLRGQTLRDLEQKWLGIPRICILFSLYNYNKP